MPDNYSARSDEFTPPSGFAAEFEEFGRAIGAAAYVAWFRGARAWIKRDGEIVVECSTLGRARWIRENYAAILASITKRRVIIEGGPVQAFAVPTHEAWWQTHDTRTGERIARGRDIEAERAEIQARLDAGEPLAEMVFPVLGHRVG